MGHGLPPICGLFQYRIGVRIHPFADGRRRFGRKRLGRRRRIDFGSGVQRLRERSAFLSGRRHRDGTRFHFVERKQQPEALRPYRTVLLRVVADDPVGILLARGAGFVTVDVLYVALFVVAHRRGERIVLGDVGQRRIAVDDETVVADDADDTADVVVVRSDPLDPAVTVDDIIAAWYDNFESRLEKFLYVQI